MNMTSTVHALTEIKPSEVSAIDLCAELSAYTGEHGVDDLRPDEVRAWRFFDERGNAYSAVLFVDAQRLGVEWGTDADWTDYYGSPDDKDAIIAAIEAI